MVSRIAQMKLRIAWNVHHAYSILHACLGSPDLISDSEYSGTFDLTCIAHLI